MDPLSGPIEMRGIGPEPLHRRRHITRQGRFGRSLAALGGLLLVAGCSGSNRPSLAPVSGVVTWRGDPVAGAEVMFMPTGGRPATGTTDADGRYRLSTFAKDDGALVGRHKVTITKRVPINDQPYAPERSEIPANYGTAATSGLEADVAAPGPNEFEFPLAGEIR